MAVVAPPSASSTLNTPRSSHVSGDIVRPFLQPEFDPAAYLNNVLPSVLTTTAGSTSTRTTPSHTNSSASVAELSAQLQSLLAQLNAHTTRLSNTLTQLTDDILRSGGRLAYEVEVLGGDARGLSDALEEGLQEEIALLAPTTATQEADQTGSHDATESDAEQNTPSESKPPPTTAQNTSTSTEDTMLRLRTLTTVRSRLDAVIQTFDAAMQWPMASTEFTAAPSLVSVSAPSSNDVDTAKLDERARQYIETLRGEISSLLIAGPEGVQAANAKVQQLQSLAEVWKGTTEEKPRLRVVESLQKLVDERTKATNGDAGRVASGTATSKIVDLRYGDLDLGRTSESGSGGGYGFLQNLRNLRGDAYASDH